VPQKPSSLSEGRRSEIARTEKSLLAGRKEKKKERSKIMAGTSDFDFVGAF
jgi:hypothetical protein